MHAAAGTASAENTRRRVDMIFRMAVIASALIARPERR
jgi:hypothetical protein